MAINFCELNTLNSSRIPFDFPTSGHGGVDAVLNLKLVHGDQFPLQRFLRDVAMFLSVRCGAT